MEELYCSGLLRGLIESRNPDNKSPDCTVNRLLLDQAADPGVVEEGGQHARLGSVHAIENANGLDAAQDVWIHCECRNFECIFLKKFHSSHLTLATYGSKQHSFLPDMFLLRVESTDDGRDVIHLEHPLTQQAPVEFLEIVVWLTLPCR